MRLKTAYQSLMSLNLSNFDHACIDKQALHTGFENGLLNHLIDASYVGFFLAAFALVARQHADVRVFARLR